MGTEKQKELEQGKPACSARDALPPPSPPPAPDKVTLSFSGKLCLASCTMYQHDIEIVLHAPKIHYIKVTGVLHIPPLLFLLLPDLDGLHKRYTLLCRTAVNPFKEI